MAQVTLRIAGRDYPVACRDGEEPHLKRLGAMLDAQSDTAQRAAGSVGERTLLYIALILADMLDETQSNPTKGPPSALLDGIAARLEAVATALEKIVPNA
jgi:cell division protein ZapA